MDSKVQLNTLLCINDKDCRGIFRTRTPLSSSLPFHKGNWINTKLNVVSIQINLQTIIGTQKETLLPTWDRNSDDFMEKVASELILHEWVRLEQVEMREDVTRGMGMGNVQNV
jgi:hypothetical protein